MRWGVAHRHGSDPELPWLWLRSAAAAPVQHLAWELLYAVGAALKSKRENKTKQTNKQKKTGKLFAKIRGGMLKELVCGYLGCRSTEKPENSSSHKI